MRTHILRVHSGAFSSDEIFRCEDCPCTFRKIGSLNAHVAKFHPVVTNEEEKSDIQIEKDKKDNESGSNQCQLVVLTVKDKSGQTKYGINCKI